MAVYDNCKIYGPYTRNDNRQHVIIIFPNKKRKTVSYPKYLMEVHLNRYLDPVLETIDHIDGDFTNNNLDNLRIISLSDHVKQDVPRNKSQSFICDVCKKTFTLSGTPLVKAFHNRLDGKTGPFCSRKCAGIAGHSKQHGTYDIKPVYRERYTLKSPDTIVSADCSDDMINGFDSETIDFITEQLISDLNI